MMKRMIQIALLALCGAAVPAAAWGVTVPQTSIADYVFTSPRLTNHIHGVLIDTTNAYGVIRSEDIDWLREAFRERECILLGRMPVKNRITLGVGPNVKSTDRPLSVLSTSWLDGGAQLLANCRLYWVEAFTNIYEQASYTNGVTNAFSVVTMPMTNGTTSVFTNKWHANTLVPITIVVTNITSTTSGSADIDLCHGLYGEPFPIYSNATKLAWWDVNSTRIPTVRYLTDAHEALRGTVRLADYSQSFTNITCTVEEEEYDYSEEHTYYRPGPTNFASVAIYKFTSVTQGVFRSSSRSLTHPFTADVTTRFDSAIATNRVSVEAAYAHCWFDYNTYPGNGVTKMAVVRLANPSLDLTGEKVYCRIPIDTHELCATCAHAAGAPPPPPSLSYRTSSFNSEVWYLSIDRITIFYRITPATKLPDW